MQTIFEAKLFLRDPAVFQPFCCVSNVTLSVRANTAAAVIVHFQIQILLIQYFEREVVPVLGHW